MIRLDKHDLAQMNLDYFRSLEKEQLVEVANNLHQLAVNQFEKLEINSENSSKPPSTDSPYKGSDSPEKTEDLQENQSEEKKKESDSQAKEKRKAGAQPGKSRKVANKSPNS